MKANKYPLGVDGTCNFCKRGKLNAESDSRMDYPYDYIYQVKGTFISFNICEDCYQDLRNNLEVEDFTKAIK